MFRPINEFEYLNEYDDDLGPMTYPEESKNEINIIKALREVQEAVDVIAPTIKMALANKTVNPNQTDEKGRSALIYAIYRTFPEVVSDLINAGANVNYTSPKGWKALHVAVQYKPTIKEQLANLSDKFPVTAKKKILDKVLSLDNDVNGVYFSTSRGCFLSAIDVAVNHKNFEAIVALFKHRAAFQYRPTKLLNYLITFEDECDRKKLSQFRADIFYCYCMLLNQQRELRFSNSKSTTRFLYKKLNDLDFDMLEEICRDFHKKNPKHVHSEEAYDSKAVIVEENKQKPYVTINIFQPPTPNHFPDEDWRIPDDSKFWDITLNDVLPEFVKLSIKQKQS